MSFFRFCRQGLTALPVFLLFSACDKLLPTGGSGELVSVKIRSVSVKGYGEASATRSAGGESRIVGQPIVQDLGNGMLAELTVEEDVSALRANLETDKTFRIIALKHSDQTYLSHADFTVGSASKPSIYVPDNVQCDFVCYSYNNADALPAWSNGDLSALSVDNSKDLLWGKDASGAQYVTNDTELEFTLSQQFTKVTLKLNGNGKTITAVADNSISLNAATSGTFNLAKGEFSSSSGNTVFTWPETINDETVTSGEVTFIPQAKYTFSFAAEAISWEEITNTGSTRAGSIGSDKFTFKPGKNYTVTLTILQLPRFAGSNIYWDSANSRLTFDPYGINNDHARYQGVYFKWGSLIGIAAGKSSESYTSGTTVLYKPTNTSDPVGTTRTWKETDDTDDAWSGSGWANIPSYSDTDIYSPVGDDAKTLLHADYAKFTAYKGDICYYINKDYRMPTRLELDSLKSYHKSFINGDIIVSKADGTYEVTTQYTTLAGIIFPASGYRYTDSGKLLIVGDFGFYWSGSASGTSDAYGAIFVSSDANTVNIHRSYGLPVRCVKIE